MYPNIPDFDAELQVADDYYASKPPADGQWFHRVSRWLNKANKEARVDDFNPII